MYRLELEWQTKDNNISYGLSLHNDGTVHYLSLDHTTEPCDMDEREWPTASPLELAEFLTQTTFLENR